ncbi:hypothetical protein JOB18_024951 [Solea senegalensis]|uniref:Receptor activity-modifying protein 1-like n=1 Tax=Solea senegalensis TaxID=28829 RepID=A0AAV6RBI6_SOLSE|nr:receptor activity-modifying protein 1-like [Solea senegalensis]KAG7502703.1 hypothetical protein JOB18_024951 [Solea senegalensis]
MALTATLLALVFIWTGMAVKYVPPCDELSFQSNVHICLSEFNKSMEMSGYHDSCPWPTVKGIYNNLKVCVEALRDKTWCKQHGSLLDNVYLPVHQTYFYLCGQLRDPPLMTAIMLIAPCIIVTLCMPCFCLLLNHS